MLDDRNFPLFLQLLTAVRDTRHPYGSHQNPLFRLHPERWLESLVVADVSVIDERLDSGALYSQVPAFSASGRAMLDVLTTTRDGRLAVVELKADEDVICPCRASTTGHECSVTTAARNFPASDISRTANYPLKSLCCTWSRPRSTCIPKRTCCFATSLPRLTGNSWGLTNTGGRE